MIPLLVLTFWAVLTTGPAFRERREARRLRLDQPAARVVWIMPSDCRPRSQDPRDPG